jgi:hypothetical protein
MPVPPLTCMLHRPTGPVKVLWESYGSPERVHGIPQESCECPVRVHRQSTEFHRSPVRVLWESMDSPWNSTGVLRESWESPWNSWESLWTVCRELLQSIHFTCRNSMEFSRTLPQSAIWLRHVHNLKNSIRHNFTAPYLFARAMHVPHVQPCALMKPNRACPINIHDSPAPMLTQRGQTLAWFPNNSVQDEDGPSMYQIIS